MFWNQMFFIQRHISVNAIVTLTPHQKQDSESFALALFIGLPPRCPSEKACQ
jgi:hypothetical protein